MIFEFFRFFQISIQKTRQNGTATLVTNQAAASRAQAAGAIEHVRSIFTEILFKQLIELFSSRKKKATNVKKDEKQQQQKT